MGQAQLHPEYVDTYMKVRMHTYLQVPTHICTYVCPQAHVLTSVAHTLTAASMGMCTHTTPRGTHTALFTLIHTLGHGGSVSQYFRNYHVENTLFLRF